MRPKERLEIGDFWVVKLEEARAETTQHSIVLFSTHQRMSIEKKDLPWVQFESIRAFANEV